MLTISSVQLPRWTTKDLLGSSLVLVEKPILIYSNLQKPGTDQVEPLHCRVQGGSGHCCSLRYPAVIWQWEYSRIVGAWRIELNEMKWKNAWHLGLYSDCEYGLLLLKKYNLLCGRTCGKCLHFLQHDMVGQMKHQTDKLRTSRGEEQGRHHFRSCVCSFILTHS